MQPSFKTSNLRFDPDLQQTNDRGFVYGGVAVPVTKPVIVGDAVGHFLTAGGMHAIGILGSRPDAGSQNVASVLGGSPDFWDVPLGWNKRHVLVRRPRLLLVIPSNNDNSEDAGPVAVAVRLNTLYPELESLGVVVAVSSRGLQGHRPLATIVPATALGSEVVTDPDIGEFYRLRPAYCAGPYVGGDIMVVELNSLSWGYGGATGIGSNFGASCYAQVTIGNTLPSSPPLGSQYFHNSTPDPGIADGAVIVWPGEMAVDIAATGPLVTKCKSYSHFVYHADRTGYFATAVPDTITVDDAGIFAAVYGGASWAQRRVVSQGDADGMWARIRTDALAFFT